MRLIVLIHQILATFLKNSKGTDLRFPRNKLLALQALIYFSSKTKQSFLTALERNGCRFSERSLYKRTPILQISYLNEISNFS